MRWLHAAAALSALALALLWGQRAFDVLHSRAEILAAADSVESVLGAGSRVVFFELRPQSVCTAFIDGAPSLNGYRGKEWVVRGYRGGLLYELRVDATLGFSALVVNLTLAPLPAALAAAAELLKTSGGGVYTLSVRGGLLALSAWEPSREACSAMVAEAERARGVAIFAYAVVQALMLTALLLAAALPLPGVRKGRLAAVVLPPLLALGVASTLLQLPYILGRGGLAPTLRTLLQLVHQSLLTSMMTLFSLVAGGALLGRARRLSLPGPREVASRWLTGVEAGVVIALASYALLSLLERLGAVVPLKLPTVENALSVGQPWIAAALWIAFITAFNATVFRFLLPLTLAEVLRGPWQAAVLSSAIYALLFTGYTVYPPYAGFLVALLVSATLCLVGMGESFLAAAAAEYTLNAVSYAMGVSGIMPFDSLALTLTPLQALPLAALLSLLVSRAAAH